jgi:hypothetical protein
MEHNVLVSSLLFAANDKLGGDIKEAGVSPSRCAGKCSLEGHFF